MKAEGSDSLHILIDLTARANKNYSVTNMCQHEECVKSYENKLRIHT